LLGVNAPLYLGVLVLIPCIIVITIVEKKLDAQNQLP